MDNRQLAVLLPSKVTCAPVELCAQLKHSVLCLHPHSMAGLSQHGRLRAECAAYLGFVHRNWKQARLLRSCILASVQPDAVLAWSAKHAPPALSGAGSGPVDTADLQIWLTAEHHGVTNDSGRSQ